MKGMSLVEVLIYLVCWSLLMSLSGYAVVTMYQVAKKSSTAIEHMMQLAIALHRITDDLHHASSWKKRGQDAAIFVLKEQDCGWLIDKKRLLRVTGCYHRGRRTWSHRAISVVLDSLESLSFNYAFKQGRLVGVKVRLCQENCSMEAFVACNGGL